jgi:DNA-binding beta-propeller fold protein YncE
MTAMTNHWTKSRDNDEVRTDPITAPLRLERLGRKTCLVTRGADLASAVAWIFAVALSLLPAHVFAADGPDYVGEIEPILQKYCLSCHTADESQGGLVMESHAALLRGGESGAAVTPGAASSSRLWLMAAGKLEPVMPPDGAKGPSADELELIAAWIDAGAGGPAGDAPPRRELRVPMIAKADSAAVPITAIAALPGDDVAVARFAEVRRIAADGRVVATLPAQPGKVNSLRVSPDGSTLLVASGVTGLFGRAAIHRLSDGGPLVEMIGHNDVIQTAIFSPDGKRVATASYDRTITLWEVATGKPTRSFTGHNGAILSIAISPDGKLLVSGSADETVKVWDVESGQRLDTMSQSQGEVHAVAITPDGEHVIAGSADNRLRVWKLLSRTSPQINPLVASRFVDETPLTHLALTRDGSRLAVISEGGNVKIFSTSDWNQIALLEALRDVATDAVITPDDASLLVSLSSGEIVHRQLPIAASVAARPSGPIDPTAGMIYVDTGDVASDEEPKLRQAQRLADVTDVEAPIELPRGIEVKGTIGTTAEEDWFAFSANAGEAWVVETDTRELNSRLDSIVEVRDRDARPITQARLQAVRDSYFTFRGKDSTQTGDFRVFAWEEMKVGEYFYAQGEVTRLWLYPRGADSGFDVFPGMGKRWTYFGTSGTTHALGEPAYIVKPLGFDEPPIANGLPVFEIPCLNDDEPTQERGKDSYLLFRAPQTGRYLVRLRDTRDEGGSDYHYRLRLRPAAPGFAPKVTPIGAKLLRGSGRELQLLADRLDGFDGEISFDIEGLPPGVISNFPVTIEPGQRFATGNIFVPIDAPEIGEFEPRIVAHAMIQGKRYERPAGTAGKLSVGDRGKVTLAVYPDNGDPKAPALGLDSVVKIRPGETISLVVRADRQAGFTAEVPLGKETSGRNLPFGSYVDNIGLNGLLIRENESERQFFITADSTTQPGRRMFFLKGDIEGGLTTVPITLEVVK